MLLHHQLSSQGPKLFQDGGGVLLYQGLKYTLVFTGLKNIHVFVFQSNFWNSIFFSKLPVDNFVIVFYSIKLFLLCYITYLCKFSLLYLFEYLFADCMLIGWNTGIVPLITRNAISLHMLSENYTQNFVRGDNLGNLRRKIPKFHWNFTYNYHFWIHFPQAPERITDDLTT